MSGNKPLLYATPGSGLCPRCSHRRPDEMSPTGYIHVEIMLHRVRGDQWGCRTCHYTEGNP